MKLWPSLSVSTLWISNCDVLIYFELCPLSTWGHNFENWSIFSDFIHFWYSSLKILFSLYFSGHCQTQCCRQRCDICCTTHRLYWTAQKGAKIYFWIQGVCCVMTWPEYWPDRQIHLTDFWQQSWDIEYKVILLGSKITWLSAKLR